MIVIVTHETADFDCAAGAAGATLLHPGAVVVFPGSKSQALREYLEREPSLLPEARTRDVPVDRVRTLVVVDTLAPDRLGPYGPLLRDPGRTEVVCYDHHPAPSVPEGVVLHHRETGAVATLFVEILKERGIVPPPGIATLLALGIHEDTGGLLHSGTTPADLSALGWLLDRGADLERARHALARNLTPDQVDLYHSLIHDSRRLSVKGRDVVLASVAADRYVPDASVVVQQFAETTGARRLVALLRMEDRVFVIARSAAPDFDAGALARRLGGGGHATASSAVLRGATRIEAEDRVASLLPAALVPAATAGQLATPILHTIEAGATVEEGVARLNRYRVNALPIRSKSGTIVGALTRQVADVAVHHGLAGNRVEDVASAEVEIVPPGTDVDELRDRVLSGSQRFVLVGTGPADVRGIVTRTVLLQHLHRDGAAAAAPDATAFLGVREDEGESVGPMLEKRLRTRSIDALRVLGEVASEAGVSAYLVGGVVRDLLLGRDNDDLDVVLESDACRIAAGFADRLGGRLRVHEAFQTAVVISPDGTRIDLATARTEHYRSPAALPEVAPGALRQDLFRRDFTMNALAVRLTSPGFGRLIDPFGGRRDLRNGKIRVLHGLSFVEDPTRAFRAVRFAVRLDFEISKETEHLLRVAARQDVFGRLSAVRLRREVARVLSERRLVRAARLLDEFDLFRVLHPRLRPTRRTWAALERAEEALAWYRLSYRPEAIDPWVVALSVLANRLERQGGEELVRRLRPSRAAAETLLDGPDRIRDIVGSLAASRSPRPSRIRELCDAASIEVLLAAMALTGRESTREAIAAYFSRIRDVRPDVTGRDLVAAGIAEGPGVRRGLAAALRRKLDAAGSTRADQMRAALAAARRA